MTQADLYRELIKGYIDINGLIKPHQTDSDSDNGTYFASIAQVLTRSNICELAVQSCYLEPGLLARKPKGVDAQQESFDDNLGRAIRCIQSGNTKEPRQVLWYGIRHAGLYNTDGKLEGKDELFRFIFVFMFIFAGAFPLLKRVVQLPLYLYCSRFKPNSISDTSGLLLQWMSCMGYEFLYGKGMETEWYRKFSAATGKKLSDIFSIYFEPDHPFTLFVRSNLD